MILRAEVGQIFVFFYSRGNPHEQGGEETQGEAEPADLFAPGAPAEQDKAAVHGMAYQCEDAADDELGSVLKREVFAGAMTALATLAQQQEQSAEYKTERRKQNGPGDQLLRCKKVVRPNTKVGYHNPGAGYKSEKAVEAMTAWVA